jgi:hypothetical protein
VALTSVIGALLLVIALIATIAATRLHRANREAREDLRQAYLSQARASRWSRRQGRRFESLDAIRKAAEIRPDMELRNEAIAALALVDLRTLKTWDLPVGCLHKFDAQYEYYARAETNGTVAVRRVRDDSEIIHWPGFGLHVRGMEFSPDGQFLGVRYAEPPRYALKVYALRDPYNVRFDLPDRWIRTFDFSTTGNVLAVAADPEQSGRRVTLYDRDTGRALSAFPTDHSPASPEVQPGWDSAGSCRCGYSQGSRLFGTRRGPSDNTSSFKQCEQHHVDSGRAPTDE